jgi:hypothetical protein
MARKCKFNFSDPAKTRWLARESQVDFWDRFSITQSSGCRYENGRGIPEPVAMLIALYYSKKITDADLLEAKAMIRSRIRSKRTSPKDPAKS